MEVDVGDNTGFNTRVEWIEVEMIKQFEIRGIKQSDSNPDLLVNIGIALVDMVKTRETDFVTDAPRYAGSMNYGWQSETVEIGSYQEGTVVFHFVDRGSMIVIWEGIARSIIEEKDEKSKKNIEVGVEKLFKNLD